LDDVSKVVVSIEVYFSITADLAKSREPACLESMAEPHRFEGSKSGCSLFELFKFESKLINTLF
jgi:hypothetical protein